jgi:integrase
MTYLLKKKGRKNKTSLYLMHYYGKDDCQAGKRKYQFLNLFIYTYPKDNLEKQFNKEMLLLARKIQAEHVLQDKHEQYGFQAEKNIKVNFLNYFGNMVEKKNESTGTYGCWKSAHKLLKNYIGDKVITLDKVNTEFLENLKTFLASVKTKNGKFLSKNSCAVYYNKITAALRQAFQERKIKDNPAERVKNIKGQDTEKNFLSFEEVQLLYNTECEVPILKSAFIAGCLVGLRFSDLQGLSWKDIYYSEQDGFSIHYIQKKTRKPMVQPVPDYIIRMWGKRGCDDEKVFAGLLYSSWYNKKLSQWIKCAGINKKISFHCSRVTFCTLHISYGTSTFLLKELVGHSSILTTEIYTKSVNKNKIAASKNIPDLCLNIPERLA